MYGQLIHKMLMPYFLEINFWNYKRKVVNLFISLRSYALRSFAHKQSSLKRIVTIEVVCTWMRFISKKQLRHYFLAFIGISIHI
jgi:hypothetical protein